MRPHRQPLRSSARALTAPGFNSASLGPDGSILPKTPGVFDAPTSPEASSATEFVLRLTGQDAMPAVSDWPVLRWKGIGHVQLVLDGSVYRGRNGVTYWTVVSHSLRVSLSPLKPLQHTTTPGDALHWLYAFTSAPRPNGF